MKCPKKRTCHYAICEKLYHNGPMTGPDIQYAVLARYRRENSHMALTDSLRMEYIVKEGSMYDLTPALRRHFEQCENDEGKRSETTAMKATPRYVPPFKPMTSYKLPIYGNRPGADFFLKLPSRFSS